MSQKHNLILEELKLNEKEKKKGSKKNYYLFYYYYLFCYLVLHWLIT